MSYGHFGLSTMQAAVAAKCYAFTFIFTFGWTLRHQSQNVLGPSVLGLKCSYTKQSSVRACDWLLFLFTIFCDNLVTKLRCRYVKFVTISWSTYYFSKIGPKLPTSLRIPHPNYSFPSQQPFLFVHAGSTCYTQLSLSITFFTVALWAENLLFQKNFSSTCSARVCFCLLDWSHVVWPITWFTCS